MGEEEEEETGDEEDDEDEDEDEVEERGEKYEVEEILAEARDKKGKVIYHIKWKGYEAESNSWELEKNVVTAAVALQRFRRKKAPALQGPMGKSDAQVPADRCEEEKTAKKMQAGPYQTYENQLLHEVLLLGNTKRKRKGI